MRVFKITQDSRSSILVQGCGLRRYIWSFGRGRRGKPANAPSTNFASAKPPNPPKPTSFFRSKPRSSPNLTTDEFSHFHRANSAEVMEYINAENKYFESQKLNWASLHRRVFHELQHCTAVYDHHAAFDPPPEISGGYAYFLRDGVYYRQPFIVPNDRGDDFNVTSSRYSRSTPLPSASSKLPELNPNIAHVLLDTNAMEANVSIGHVSMSNDHSILAYVEKHVGEEDGTLRFKLLSSEGNEKFDSIMVEKIEKVVNFVWSNDGKAIIYTRMNRQLRPNKVFIHLLGTDPQKEDRVIFSEDDDRFFVDVSTTKDRKLICINSNSRTSSEVHTIDGDLDFGNKKNVPMNLICKRRQGIEYYIDHHNDMIYVVTNAFNGIDFHLACAPARDPSSKNWKKLLELDENIKLEDVDVFHDHVVIYSKESGLPVVIIYDIPTNETHKIPLPESICTVIPGINRDFYADNVRFNVISAGFREVVYEYRFRSKQLLPIRTVPIPDFNRKDFSVRRIHFPLPENMFRNDSLPNELPITLIHSKNVKLPKLLQGGLRSNEEDLDINTIDQPRESKKVPILIQTYNSYGMDATLPFDPLFIPLLKRGWVIAACHGSGGSEFGKGWYRRGLGSHGKLRAVQEVEYFVKHLYNTNECILAGIGVSAGGCIMGSLLGRSWYFEETSVNKNIFSTMVLHVPFLDPITAMQDPYAALTTTEHEEWGNPLENIDDYKMMMKYSPYELIPDVKDINVEGKGYKFPSILLTTGLKDQRVPYWHPLKWTARMRERLSMAYGPEVNDDVESRLMLLARKDAGHFGDTTDATVEDAAWWLSFLINEVDLRQAEEMKRYESIRTN